ncbi:hypothetical protein C7953_2995, partial [Halanaerobium congolense]
AVISRFKAFKVSKGEEARDSGKVGPEHF